MPLPSSSNEKWSLSPSILGLLVVSDDSREALQFVFDKIKIYRIHLSSDPSLFCLTKQKQQQIAFMPRKAPNDATEIVSAIQARGRLANWNFLPLIDLSKDQVASHIKESAILLNFCRHEGFGLIVQEAMSAGTIVIGPHGGGGKELIKKTYAFPLGKRTQALLMDYVQLIEEVALDMEKRPTFYQEMGEQASRFIQQNYAEEQEVKDLQESWGKLCEEHNKRLQRLCLQVVVY